MNIECGMIHNRGKYEFVYIERIGVFDSVVVMAAYTCD